MKLARLAGLVALYLVACASTPAPSAAPTPTPSATPTSAATASPSPEPTIPPPTQALVLAAVGRWLVTDRGGRIGDSVYIDATLGERAWYSSENNPDLGNTLPTPFERELTEESRTALTAALSGVAIEFVDDPQSVVDPGAAPQMGCRPYLNYRPMLHLGAPLPRRGAPTTFFIEVNYDQGCGGNLYLLQVGQDAAGDYRVIRVVNEGSWIV